MSQTSAKPSSGPTLPPPNLTYYMSKWSLCKAKCQGDTSRPLSWTTLAWMSQTSPMPSYGPITWFKWLLLRCFGHLGGKCHLDIWLCLKDHFDKSLVCFSEGHVGPDEGFGDVWDIHASVVQDRGLEMSSWHLAFYKDHYKSEQYPKWGTFFFVQCTCISLLDVKFSLDVK